MDLNSLSVFDVANQNMNYLTEKQKVIATNIANANTPGYLSQDVEKPKFADELKKTLPLNVTNEKHLSGLPSDRGSPYKIFTPKPANALTIDGNGVVIEDQLNEAAKARGDYGRIISIYGQYRTMIRTANTKING